MGMIKQETVKIEGKEYIHTWSTAGKYVVRDKVEYSDAIDPAGTGREYTEGDYIDPDRESAIMYAETREVLEGLYDALSQTQKGKKDKDELTQDVFAYYNITHEEKEG